MRNGSASKSSLCAVFATLYGGTLPEVDTLLVACIFLHTQLGAWSSILGAVIEARSSGLTVNAATGNAVAIATSSSTHNVRPKPPQRRLADATPIELSDVSSRIRVLVADPTGANNTLTANVIIVIKKLQIGARCRVTNEGLLRNRADGILTCLGPSTNTIALTSGANNLTRHALCPVPVSENAECCIAFTNVQSTSLLAIKSSDLLHANSSHRRDTSVVTGNASVPGDSQKAGDLALSASPAQLAFSVKDPAIHKLTAPQWFKAGD